MSAFHRIDNYEDMESARFFRLARRLFAYKGVLRARIEAEESKKNPSASRGQEVPMSDPAISQYFEVD